MDSADDPNDALAADSALVSSRSNNKNTYQEIPPSVCDYHYGYPSTVQRRRRPVTILLALLLSASFWSIALGTTLFFQKSKGTDEDDNSRIFAALDSLQSHFNASHGSWMGGRADPERGLTDSGTIGRWHAANTLEVLCVALKRLPPSRPIAWGEQPVQIQRVKAIIDRVFEKQNATGILASKSFDDMGWVSLASWLQAYALTSDASHLQRAVFVWETIRTEGWDLVCGGGVYWAGDEAEGGLRYKNAIANGLFVVNSMRLYDAHKALGEEQASEYYLAWAQKAWVWFRSSGMIVHNGTRSYVAGGLDTSNCECDGSEGFTYNQGVVVGGLGLLHAATSDTNERAALIEAADAIAYGVVQDGSRWLDKNGVLVEPREPADGSPSDRAQFKGIFVRYLRLYVDVVGDASRRREEYERFLRTNADAVWTRARGLEDAIGFEWDGPPPTVDAPNAAITQTSGLDALLAVMPQQKDNA